MLHVPTGAVDVEPSGKFFIKSEPHAQLNAIIRRYGDGGAAGGSDGVIVGAHGTHIHSDSFKMYYDGGKDADSDVCESVVNTRTHTHAQTNTHTRAHTHVLTCAHTFTLLTRTDRQTDRQTDTHTHVYTHTHAHKHR